MSSLTIDLSQRNTLISLLYNTRRWTALLSPLSLPLSLTWCSF